MMNDGFRWSKKNPCILYRGNEGEFETYMTGVAEMGDEKRRVMIPITIHVDRELFSDGKVKVWGEFRDNAPWYVVEGDRVIPLEEKPKKFKFRLEGDDA